MFFKNIEQWQKGVVFKESIDKKVKYKGASYDIKVFKFSLKIYSKSNEMKEGICQKISSVYVKKTGQIAYQRKDFVAKFKKGWVKDYLELFQDTENNQIEPPLLLSINYNRNFLILVKSSVAVCLVIGSYLGWRRWMKKYKNNEIRRNRISRWE